MAGDPVQHSQKTRAPRVWADGPLWSSFWCCDDRGNKDTTTVLTSIPQSLTALVGWEETVSFGFVMVAVAGTTPADSSVTGLRREQQGLILPSSAASTDTGGSGCRD